MHLNASFQRRITPLLLSQFFGVFNDNAYKMFVVLAVFGGSVDYFQNSAFLFILTVAYVLPFLLLGGPAGNLSDKMPKRSILILTKVAEFAVMILGTVCFVHTGDWGIFPLMAVMFLMTAQSSFFSPAFNGILPETFPEHELSRANGYVGMFTFIAAIIGAGSAPILWAVFKKDLMVCGELMCLFSVLGFFISLLVLPVPPQKSRKKQSILKSIRAGWKAVTENRGIFISALGDTFFVSIGVAIQTLIIIFAKFTLDSTPMELSALLLAPALGMGIGCYLAGLLSGNKIELGLVPFGGLGIALFLPLAGYFPGSAVPVIERFGLVLHLWALLYLLLAGIAGGLFIVPFRAYFQQRVSPQSRGAALAFSNVLTFGGVLISSAVVFLLIAGAATNVPGLPAWVDAIVRHMPSFAPPTLFLAVSLMTLVFLFAIMRLMPDFLVRSFIFLLTHTLYRLKVTGEDRIPDHGPALLVSNHASFVDGFMISACTSRRIRFLMHEDYYQIPLLNPFARFAGFIEVPRLNRIKSMSNMIENVKDALRQGDIVCVFPEGKITRNGIMDEFRGGFKAMLPDDVHVPVIPVRIGMIWGSIFSYYYGRLKLRFPKELPHPVTISFGKPVPHGITAYELRQTISELAADTDMTPRPSERPLHYQIARHAKLTPFRVLACDYGGGETTAFQFYVRSAILSRKIRELVAPDCEYVGVMMPNCTAAAIATVAVMMADKVPAMMNFTASRDAMRSAIDKASITHILTSRKFLSKIKMEPLPEMVFLEDIAAGVTRREKILMTLAAALLPHQEFMNILSPTSHRDVMRTAVILFSSGSTGIPKGVMLSHHNFNSDIHSFLKVMNWTDGDSVLGSLPLFHAFGLNTCFWLPLMIGCKVVYVTSPLDSEAVGKAVEKYQLTILLATPTFMQNYMRKCKPEQFKSLRLAIAGAEKLRTDISAKFEYISNGERVLIEGYGCTELSPIVAINIGSSVLDLGKQYGKKGSIGPAMPGICARIVDPVTRKPLPQDTEGLLVIKGPNVMQGYLGEPELTAEAVQDGWYNTGDIARIDGDGYITLCGRLSRFSKIGGEMVPHELVECAINEIIGTDEKVAAVSSIPDPQKGEALIVLYTKLPVSPEKIIEEMRACKITNLWIPKAANFYKIDAIPMLGSGKLDLVALRAEADKIAARVQKNS